MDIVSEEFIIRLTKTDAEALALVIKNELTRIQEEHGNKALSKCRRLIQMNECFARLADKHLFSITK